MALVVHAYERCRDVIRSSGRSAIVDYVQFCGKKALYAALCSAGYRASAVARKLHTRLIRGWYCNTPEEWFFGAIRELLRRWQRCRKRICWASGCLVVRLKIIKWLRMRGVKIISERLSYFVSRVRKIAKIAYYLRHIRLSSFARTYQRAPTGRISVKVGIGDFCEYLSRKSKFGANRTKVSDTLHEDLSIFYCFRRQKCTVKTFLCYTQYCWNKAYANA